MGVMIAPVDGSGSCPAWMQTVEKRAVFGSFMVSGPTLFCYHSLCNLPIPVTTPGPSPPREPFWFVRTLPGRVFLLSSVLLLILIVVRLFAPLPDFVELFRKVVRVAWFLSLAAVVYLVVSRSSGRFLWRVRQKLILSLSLIHISEPTRLLSISYAVFCLKKKK